MTKNSLIFAVAFATSLSVAGVASAQESNFEGFYVGGQAGYSDIDDDLDGFGGGGFVGFGGTNGILYGSIEAEVGYDGAEGGEDVSGSGFSISADAEAQLTYGVGFRVGAVVADDFLIYGRVGWVRTNAELEVAVNVTGLGSASWSEDQDFDGLRIGGGVEGMLADNIGVRGEYTYTMYEDEDVNVFGAIPANIDPDQHLFRVGVAWYF
jgi:outer membrane immunogenic protein